MPRKPTNGKKTMMFSYDRNLVKTANERLRKLETVNKLAPSSQAYRTVQKYAIEEPNSMSNKFYRIVTNKDGTTGIRFITPKDYKKLSAFEQKKFNEALNSFLNNQTTTKLGIMKARLDAYKNFMDNHPNLNWTQDEYERFWKNYEQLQADEEDKNSYNRLTQFFEEPGEYNEDLTDDKIQQIFNYTSGERRYSDIPIRSNMTNRNNRRR